MLVPADRAARAGAAADAVVAVLLAQPDGSVKLADVSAAMRTTAPPATCRCRSRAAAQRADDEVDADGSVSIDWQFAFGPRDAPLRLVGLRTETSVRWPTARAGARWSAPT